MPKALTVTWQPEGPQISVVSQTEGSPQASTVSWQPETELEAG